MNVKRIMHLIWCDLCMQKKIIPLATLGLSFLLFLLGKGNDMGTYTSLLNTGGVLITSYAFADLHRTKRGYAYLMLPASQFEKFFSRWFLTSVGYAGFSLLVYGLFSKFINYSATSAVFNASIWSVFAQYIVLQSVVFLGAIYFKRYRLLKTAVAVGVLMFVVIMLLALLVYIMNPGDMLTSWLAMMDVMSRGGYYFFWMLLAPLSLITAYVRFKEYEI
jgi:hypothetical protein